MKARRIRLGILSGTVLILLATGCAGVAGGPAETGSAGAATLWGTSIDSLSFPALSLNLGQANDVMRLRSGAVEKLAEQSAQMQQLWHGPGGCQNRHGVYDGSDL